MTFQIIAEQPEHSGLLDPLLDRTFGFDRLEKTVYKLRDNQAPLADLSFAAVVPDKPKTAGQTPGDLLGSLRFWPVQIDGVAAILLGPLAVEPALQGQGIGRALLQYGLAKARQFNHRLCIVVGDPDYYGPYGFTSAMAAGLLLPGPVAAERFQVLELAAGALTGVSGRIGRADAAESGKGRRGDAVA